MAVEKQIGKALLAAGAITGALLTGRYLGARKMSAAERLTNVLLDTAELEQAAAAYAARPDVAAARAAIWLLKAGVLSSDAFSCAGGVDDPVGTSRTRTHGFSRTVATVLTESQLHLKALTWAVTMPEGIEVRGTRTVGTLGLSGLNPARPVRDAVQMTFSRDYTVQMETSLELTEYLLCGHTRLFGSCSLRDSSGCAGYAALAYDGALSGTVSRYQRVVGRFRGSTADGLDYKAYYINEPDMYPSAPDMAGQGDAGPTPGD